MNIKTLPPIEPQSVAFLGLGVMGYPMAGHLARAGHRVTVYNRTAAKSAQWAAEYGGRTAASPREAAAGAAAVFACVGNLCEMAGVYFAPIYKDWQPGDIVKFDVSNEKLKRAGFTFRQSFGAGLYETYKWYLDYARGIEE